MYFLGKESTNKKNIMKFTLLIFIVLLFGNASCSSQTRIEKTSANQARGKEDILIVYLTRTGNTKAIARMIQENTGGDLIALELENPYPKDYQTTVKQVAEENEKGYLPTLKTKIDIRKYDTIFVGFPTWGMQLPPPMKSFLRQNDLSGKTIVPFNTNAGYGVGSGFQTVREFCPKSKILEGFEIKGGIERDGILFVMEGAKEREAREKVRDWLQKIGLVQRSKSK